MTERIRQSRRATLEIIARLTTLAPRGATTDELAIALGITRRAALFRIDTLRRAGLVRTDADGRHLTNDTPATPENGTPA